MNATGTAKRRGASKVANHTEGTVSIIWNNGDGNVQPRLPRARGDTLARVTSVEFRSAEAHDRFNEPGTPTCL